MDSFVRRTERDVHQAVKMRVLMIHDALPRPKHSGSDSRLFQLLEGLVLLGHSVTFLARHGSQDCDVVKSLEKHAVVVNGDPEHMRFFGLAETWGGGLAQLALEGRFDLAILTTWFWFGLSIPEQ